MTLYPFEMQIAVDANNPDTVVQAGLVTIADPETGSTITIVDPAGLPMANPIETSAQGFIPAFQATIPHVKWSDGMYAGYLSSYKGLLEEAKAARLAAEAAQLGGVPAGGTTGQVLVKASDTSGHAAWADASGGGGGGAEAVADAISGMTGAMGYGDNRLTTDHYALFTYDTSGNFRIVGSNSGGDLYSRIYNTVGDRGRLKIEASDQVAAAALQVSLFGGESVDVPHGTLDLDPMAGESALRYLDPIQSRNAEVSLYSGGVAISATNGVHISAKYVRVPSSTTAARPTAAAAGVGGHLFDTTLGKPIWSNGTSWRDAAGTVV